MLLAVCSVASAAWWHRQSPASEPIPAQATMVRPVARTSAHPGQRWLCRRRRRLCRLNSWTRQPARLGRCACGQRSLTFEQASALRDRNRNRRSHRCFPQAASSSSPRPANGSHCRGWPHAARPRAPCAGPRSIRPTPSASGRGTRSCAGWRATALGQMGRVLLTRNLADAARFLPRNGLRQPSQRAVVPDASPARSGSSIEHSR